MIDLQCIIRYDTSKGKRKKGLRAPGLKPKLKPHDIINKPGN